MKSVRVAWSIGIVALAFSVDGLGRPPEGKGKPAHAGPSPFIEFPVPQHAVGVIHSRAVRGLGKGHDKEIWNSARSADLQSSLPMATGGFPTTPKNAPIPECIAR